jgi:hypothetical protein
MEPEAKPRSLSHPLTDVYFEVWRGVSTHLALNDIRPLFTLCWGADEYFSLVFREEFDEIVDTHCPDYRWISSDPWVVLRTLHAPIQSSQERYVLNTAGLLIINSGAIGPYSTRVEEDIHFYTVPQLVHRAFFWEDGIYTLALHQASEQYHFGYIPFPPPREGFMNWLRVFHIVKTCLPAQNHQTVKRTPLPQLITTFPKFSQVVHQVNIDTTLTIVGMIDDNIYRYVFSSDRVMQSTQRFHYSAPIERIQLCHNGLRCIESGPLWGKMMTFEGRPIATELFADRFLCTNEFGEEVLPPIHDDFESIKEIDQIIIPPPGSEEEGNKKEFEDGHDFIKQNDECSVDDPPDWNYRYEYELYHKKYEYRKQHYGSFPIPHRLPQQLDEFERKLRVLFQ